MFRRVLPSQNHRPIPRFATASVREYAARRVPRHCRGARRLGGPRRPRPRLDPRRRRRRCPRISGPASPPTLPWRAPSGRTSAPAPVSGSSAPPAPVLWRGSSCCGHPSR
ncbi:hypothetical protein BDA96_10G138800 [Sorghum bicolor]|uniref:Uncharacterized protein n=2 Tax=Sorghum bicolor TaxID=4558 RepID=A0A921U0L8_SORBI|nr:hypothetical protein BDA96_10G138800 [Sorghum bicolor]KAG0513850.1 hypothetical protein BDA96_10G138800 [Sorghum bicolor]KXG19776.1 hypothetical protein SORBI_3010G113400 [Sorghum bicolor]